MFSIRSTASYLLLAFALAGFILPATEATACDSGTDSAAASKCCAKKRSSSCGCCAPARALNISEPGSEDTRPGRIAVGTLLFLEPSGCECRPTDSVPASSRPESSPTSERQSRSCHESARSRLHTSRRRTCHARRWHSDPAQITPLPSHCAPSDLSRSLPGPSVPRLRPGVSTATRFAPGCQRAPSAPPASSFYSRRKNAARGCYSSRRRERKDMSAQDQSDTNVFENVIPDPILGEDRPLTRWRKFRMVVKVVELRLRFIALMAATGLVFAYWDTLWNYYDKWTRPVGDHVAAASDIEYYCPMHPSVVRDDAGQLPDLRHAAVETEEGSEGRVAGGGNGPRPACTFPRGAGGNPNSRDRLRAACRDRDHGRLRHVRRTPALPHLFQNQGVGSGREAFRQRHRNIRGCRSSLWPSSTAQSSIRRPVSCYSRNRTSSERLERPNRPGPVTPRE